MPEQISTDHDLLIELNTDMKNVLGSIDSIKKTNEMMHADHEVRIRALESQGNQWVGKGSIIGGLLGLGAGFAGALFGNWKH